MSIQQKAYLGIDCFKDFNAILKKYNPKKVFLVRGKKSYQLCGAEKIINESFNEFSPEIISFYDFEENPKIEDVHKGLFLLKEFNPDIIIAIGGGSVLDISKLIRFFYSYEGEETGNKFKIQRPLVPLFAVPTTAGTGCEATHFAVMYKDKVKYSVEHDDILPDYAFVYPPFTYNTPPYLTACTGFDALAQSIEAFWNVNATKESDEYAMKAIRLLWPNLSIAVNSPTEDIRNNIGEGAYWAGRAINITKTTAPHAFSYYYTSKLGINHGEAVAITFPLVFQKNLPKIGKEKLQFFSEHSINEKSITNLINKIFNYSKHIRLLNEHLNDMMENVNAKRLVNNPSKIEKRDFLTYISLMQDGF